MNILRKTTGIVAFIALAIQTTWVNAQPTKEGAEQVVTKFTTAFENLPKTKSNKEVLQYVSKDLFSTIINSSVADNFGLIRSTYEDFEAFTADLATQSDMDVQYKINKILKTNFRGRSAVVVCDISYQYKKGNVIQRKGIEATTFVLRYFEKGWKIINFNVVNMEEELNVGQCVCEVFSASTGNYMTKTTVPAGNAYSSEIDQFEINRGQGGIYFISSGDKEYTWVRNGDITRQDKETNKQVIVGSAVDELEAVLKIVENDLYKGKCSEFRRRR